MSVVAAGTAMVAAAALAAAPSASALPSGSKSIRNANSSLCMGIWSYTGIEAIQWGCNGNPDQLWKFDLKDNGYITVTNRAGKCLGIYGGSTDKGTDAVAWACNGNADQMWWMDTNQPGGTFRLVNRNSGKCLGVYGAATNQGANLIQWDCNNNDDQRWYRQGDGI
ncbi:RICIN domain-containing protein [Streptomyces sp. WM6372]|uniref:RICIN domain-containing protein n=1 Tax=Streptomyces sp. WM6372 TaxID=1415555 RepID=UPI0006AE98A6|nr:RICIN domain-containing protein [Streptomyces sp. WM6372]